MVPLTGLLLLGSSELALGAVAGKRAPPVVELPEGAKTQLGIPQGWPCTKYILVDEGEGCNVVAKRAGIDPTNFMSWNSPTDPNCKSLWAGSYACVDTRPLQPRVAKDCTRFMPVEDGSTCDSLSVKAQVNINRIFDLNPDVGPECHNLLAGAHACVAANTTGSDEPVAAVPEGRRAQDGVPKDCKLFVPVDRGDTCDSLSIRYSVTLAALKELNKCNDYLTAGYYACITGKAVEAADKAVIPEAKLGGKGKPAETKGKDEAKVKDETNGLCHALDTNEVDVSVSVSGAPASTPARPCGNVGGVSVAVDHSLDVAVGSQSHSTHDGTQGTVRPGSSLIVDHSLEVAVGSPSH